MKTLKDVRKVAEIADRLLELGVPKNICDRIHKWNRKQEERIQRERSRQWKTKSV